MRIGIREQLAVVCLIISLVPLAVLAIAAWLTQQKFVVDVTSRSLSLTASLKASQISSSLLLIQSTCATIVTRILLQDALKTFYLGDTTSSNWAAASADVSGALASGGLSALLQVIVFSRNQTGDPDGLLNITGQNAEIKLPGTSPNDSAVILGDPGLGYPTELYPNITYIQTSSPDPADPSVNATIASAFADFPLNSTSYLYVYLWSI
jgi:osomolarity two-component system sensor histidine kinase SLN1